MNLDNLFKRIKKQGLTAKKVSEDTGISTGNISDWKSGRSVPSAQKLDILANYLDCSVDYLLGRTEEKEKPTAPKDDELSELLKDPETREFYELIKDFSDDELEDLLNYGQYLIAKRDPKEKP